MRTGGHSGHLLNHVGILFNEVKGDLVFVLTIFIELVRHLVDLLHYHLLVEAGVFVLLRKKLSVHDFKCVADRVIFSLKSSVTRQDRIVDAFHKDNFVERVEVLLLQVVVPLSYIRRYVCKVILRNRLLLRNSFLSRREICTNTDRYHGRADLLQLVDTKAKLLVWRSASSVGSHFRVRHAAIVVHNVLLLVHLQSHI
jgi:hypothetical protein